MRVFDPTDTPAQAFLRGFLSGFSSPAMLFSYYDDASRRLNENPLITARKISVKEALSGDVRRIGDDLRTVMRKYATDNNLS